MDPYVSPPEPIYLNRIITATLTANETQVVHSTEKSKKNYQTIGQYDVTNYEEKSFETNIDE